MTVSELFWELFTFPGTGENEPAYVDTILHLSSLYSQHRSFPKTEGQQPDLTLTFFFLPLDSQDT